MLYSYVATLNNYNVEDVVCYKISKELGNKIYTIVRKWDFLDQKTTGIQLIRSIDSIAANIAEGFGRYHKKDKIKFFYNARASAYEFVHWVKTACTRKLIAQKDYDQLMPGLGDLPKQINYLIKMTQTNLSI